MEHFLLHKHNANIDLKEMGSDSLKWCMGDQCLGGISNGEGVKTDGKECNKMTKRQIHTVSLSAGLRTPESEVDKDAPNHYQNPHQTRPNVTTPSPAFTPNPFLPKNLFDFMIHKISLHHFSLLFLFLYYFNSFFLQGPLRDHGPKTAALSA